MDRHLSNIMLKENLIMEVLMQPFSTEEIMVKKDENNYIEGVIRIDLSDAIDNDSEGFLDLISEKLVNSSLLMDINYEIVGSMHSSLLLQVSGDVSCLITEDEE